MRRDRRLRAITVQVALVGASLAAAPNANAAAKPDLRVSSVRTAASSVAQGGSVRVNTTIAAVNADAGRSKLAVYLSTASRHRSADRQLGGDIAVATIQKAAHRRVGHTFTVAKSVRVGRYYVSACADAGRQVTESDEGNNCRTSTSMIKVVAGGGDLMVTAVAGPKNQIPTGAAFAVTDTVRNAGTSRVAATRTALLLSTDAHRSADDVPVATHATAALSSGQSRTTTTTVTLSREVPAASYYLLACADNLAVAPEANESNNCRALAVRLVAGSVQPPLHANPTLEPAQSATSQLTIVGGTVTATSADGTVYTLRIPFGALLSPEQITMTPLESVSGVPMSSPSLAGVDLEPDGLVLQKAATLTITPPAPIPVTKQTVFTAAADGSNYHAYPLETSTETITVDLNHFCLYDVHPATSDEQDAVATHVPDTEQAVSESEVAPLVVQHREGTLEAEDFADRLDAHYEFDWYDHVKPLLDAAKTDAETAYDAVPAYLAWARSVTILGLANGEPFQGWVTSGMSDMLAIIKHHFDDAATQCAQDNHPQEQFIRMLQDARIASVLASDADGVLGSDYLDKIHACEGPDQLNFSATAKRIIDPDFEWFGWNSTTADGQAVGVPLRADTTHCPGICLSGQGDLAISNVAVADRRGPCTNTSDTWHVGPVKSATHPPLIKAMYYPRLDLGVPVGTSGFLSMSTQDDEDAVTDCLGGVQPDALSVFSAPLNESFALQSDHYLAAGPQGTTKHFSGRLGTARWQFDVTMTYSVTQAPI
jgi:hypothetical protein